MVGTAVLHTASQFISLFEMMSDAIQTQLFQVVNAY